MRPVHSSQCGRQAPAFRAKIKHIDLDQSETFTMHLNGKGKRTAVLAVQSVGSILNETAVCAAP